MCCYETLVRSVQGENGQYKAHAAQLAQPPDNCSNLLTATRKYSHIFWKSDSAYISAHPVGRGSITFENSEINTGKWRDEKCILTWRKFPFLHLVSGHREWANERYLTKKVKLLIRKLYFEIFYPDFACFIVFLLTSFLSVDNKKMLKLFLNLILKIDLIFLI